MFRPTPVRRSGRLPCPLEQRLAHQAEVEVLQVAEAAVDELGRAAGGARREVVALNERHAVPARGRVERDSRAGDPAAHHHQVEALLLQGFDCVLAPDHGRYVT
jgi:hypothetical protein